MDMTRQKRFRAASLSARVDRFCARCGSALAAFDDDGIERQRCARCGRIAYRNSKPAVGAIVARGGSVLLSRRARPPHAGEWDLPGGFLESGEHPEAGILRELREETGLAARVVRLAHVGMGRYDEDDTLNLVYLVEADGEPVAGDDSEELRWFALDALPPMAFGHEREALRAYARGPIP